MKQTLGGFFAATALSGSLMMAAPAFAQDNNPADLLSDTETSSQTQIQATAGDGSELFEQSWLQSAGSPVDFNNPWIMLGWPPALLALWLALRAVPMRPRDVEFGPIFLLEQLETFESEADQMALPEKLLWASALSASFLAVSHPVPNQNISFSQDGAIVIAVDADWAAAPNWNEQRNTIHEILRHAHNDSREIVFLNTAKGENGEPIIATNPMHAAAALSHLENMQTVPWPADRNAAIEALESLQEAGSIGATFWISNGLTDDATPAFTEALQSLAPLTVYDELNKPALLMPAEYRNGEYHITVQRSDIGAAETLEIEAFDSVNRVIASQEISFAEDAVSGAVVFDQAMLSDAHGDVARFSIAHENTAGATVLVNENHKPRSVGIAAVNGRNDAGSLLNEARFLYAALQPHTDIYFGTVEELVRSNNVSVMLIPDSIPLTGAAAAQLEEWARGGGTVARFAGPNMALEGHSDDPLLPVDIRKGSIGAADSLSSDQENIGIQSFDLDSPFAALEPESNITISRYVAVDTTRPQEYETWARMSNGFPLVTANAIGNGRVVLFHTTANSAWSDMAFSDNFVEMLLSGVKSATSIESTQDYAMPELPPLSVLNSAGELSSPSAIVEPLTQDKFDTALIGPQNPPGLYGSSLMQVPFNLSHAVTNVEPLGAMPEEITHEFYSDGVNEQSIQGWLWATALALALGGSLALGVRNGLVGNNARSRQDHNDPAPDL